ncbi:hypothetical protein ES319_A04G140500v1 [Gossypium barbadense]|uniref:Uncharacterized protein n=1 Tax=Gossypium barbadense TaxID=3634 RepID=A0A5J5W7A8_GOSBA|nr:hypothetical protein ES319_A04G140500v1 [Gossypium barbadense]
MCTFKTHLDNSGRIKMKIPPKQTLNIREGPYYMRFFNQVGIRK